MAVDDTPAAPEAGTYDPATLNTIIQRLMQQPAPPQPVAQPSSTEGRGALSLLGEAIGGGEQYGTTQQREAAGLRALQSMGMNMMANSGYAPVRTPFGQILASGMQGAQQSLGESQSVEAAQMGAQQQYAEKQQEMQLERLKAVLPLLQLQGRQGLPSPFAQGTGGAAPGTNVATGGSIATVARDPSVPTAGQQGNNSGNLMADSSLPPGATGRIPVAGGRFVAAFPDVPTGVAAQSDNLNAYKAAGVQTIRQAVNRWVGDPKANTDSYAADVAKAAGVDPDAPVDLSDPKIQRAFLLAQQPHESGKSWLAPADVDKGLALAAARRAAPPGATTATTTAPAPYKVASTGAIPPPPSSSSTAPAAATPAADDTFFPNAPAAPAPQQTSQADQPPAQPPVTTPPAAAPLDIKSAPDTTLNPEQYIQKHWTPLSPEEVARYAPGPENQLAVDRARQVQQAQADAAAARQTYLNVQSGRVPGDLNKSLSDMNTADARADAAEKDYNTAVQGLKTSGSTNLLAADDQQRQQLRADFKSTVLDPAAQARELAQTAAEKERDRQAAVALKAQEGQQAIELANVNAGISTSTKLQEAYNTDAQNSGKRIDDLELLRGLSDNAGTPTLLTNIKVGDRSLADIISATGFGGKDLQDKVGAVQAFRAGILNTVRELRSGGAATGEPRSNQDLQFVQDMAPNEWQQPATRSAIISFLQQVNQRRIDMAAEVSRLMATRGSNGQLMPAGEAIAQARQNLPDFVQKMPDGGMDNTPAGLAIRKDFFNKSVPPHTFFRYPNGRIDLYNGPGGQ